MQIQKARRVTRARPLALPCCPVSLSSRVQPGRVVMKNWIVGGLAVACAGVAVGLWLARKETSEPAARPEPPPVAAAIPPAKPPAPPAVLADVVEVADLDPLLDPPSAGAAGE